MPTYSKHEVEGKLDEILQKVQAGERVVIALDGEEVAEIRPLAKRTPLEERLPELERRGIIGPVIRSKKRLRPIAHRPGALARFLRTRD
jgi:antitoxin (DNA-binding transcriptional repressor) of toxin-antitoxin stability system